MSVNRNDNFPFHLSSTEKNTKTIKTQKQTVCFDRLVISKLRGHLIDFHSRVYQTSVTSWCFGTFLIIVPTRLFDTAICYSRVPRNYDLTSDSFKSTSMVSLIFLNFHLIKPSTWLQQYLYVYQNVDY